MIENEEIELSAIQATAYWWTNTIRSKVKEIVTKKSSDQNEVRFAQMFYYFTEVEWRNLYLNLIDCITEEVNNFFPQGLISDSDAFSQDTDKGGHDSINSGISKMIDESIPDIRLASNDSKDWVTYTSIARTEVWYKSGGSYRLPLRYEPSYVLTGDGNALDFYNQVISTLAVLEQKDLNFRSVALVRERFCAEYKRLYSSEETLKEIYNRFNKAFNMASDRGIIMGRSYQESYSTHFNDIDYVGLEDYMEIAEHYANVILQIENDQNVPAERVHTIHRKEDDTKH